jgi:hypothetical protein
MKFICKGCEASCIIKIKDSFAEPPKYCSWTRDTVEWVVRVKKEKETDK